MFVNRRMEARVTHLKFGNKETRASKVGVVKTVMPAPGPSAHMRCCICRPFLEH